SLSFVTVGLSPRSFNPVVGHENFAATDIHYPVFGCSQIIGFTHRPRNGPANKGIAFNPGPAGNPVDPGALGVYKDIIADALIAFPHTQVKRAMSDLNITSFNNNIGGSTQNNSAAVNR